MDLTEANSQTAEMPTKPLMTRRKWLNRAAALATFGAVGVVAYAHEYEPHWVEVVHLDMPIVGLPQELEGKTLVQISDIHIGDRVDDNFLINWFQTVTSWRPDLVLFTGDFLTLRNDKSLPTKKMKDVLATFPQGSLGTFGILGNHDYGVKWQDPIAADTVVEIAEESGIHVLRNEANFVQGLQLVGFDDFFGTNFGGRKVLSNVDLDLPTLVMCHNPDVVDLPVWHGYQGWILSGHTHGGQCKLPGFGPPILPVFNKRYSAGLFPLADGRRLYVNRALGHSLKIRFNVRPEITVFRLLRDQRDNANAPVVS